MLNKTKAALQSCQCHYEMFKQEQNTRISTGGQSLSRMHICILEVAPMVHPSLYGYVSRCEENRISVLSNFSKALESASEQNQLFGSIPRCCSSFRNIRLIHVARDESPSLRISSSSCARNSSLKRIWYCGDFFNSCIDMCNYPDYHLIVITRVITFGLKSNAPDCSSSAEASNQTVIRGNDHG